MSPPAYAFGDVAIGASATELFTVSHSGVASGPLAVSLSGADAAEFSVSEDRCQGQVLEGAQTCTLVVTFIPSGTDGPRTGTLQVEGTSGTGAATALSGEAFTPAAIGLDLDNHDFGILDVGRESAPVTFTVTNSGGRTTGTLSAVVSGDGADFLVDDRCTGTFLVAAQRCTIDVAFAPKARAAKQMQIAISGDPGGTLTLTVTGTGRDYATLIVAQPFGGDGAGTVSGGGISCPGMCSAQVARTAVDPPQLKLTATAAGNASFEGWIGDCASAGSAADCTLTLDSDKAVGASFAIKTFTVTVSLVSIGGAAGQVTSVSSPSAAREIDCPGTCSTSVASGTTVTLTAVPGPGYWFGGWGSGNCSDFSSTCTFTVTEAQAQQAKFTPANLAFATASTYTLADIKAQATDTTSEATKMLSGADAICRTLGGSNGFRAWLASSSANAATRLGPARGWVRHDGRVFKDQIASVRTYHPVRFAQDGSFAAGSDYMWTGAHEDGSANALLDCADWAGTGNAIGGHRLGGGPYWSHYAQLRCDGAFRLLCLGTAYAAVVGPPTPPAGARYAFVTQALPATGGVSGFDAACANDAAAAGLTGSYKAIVATQSRSAASRFTARGVAVVRQDHAIVADSDAAFLGGTEGGDASMSVLAGGADLNRNYGWAWTGASGPAAAGTSASTCGDWTTSTGNGFAGYTFVPSWFFAANLPCTWNSAVVMCLEE